jgi:phosphoribosyl 1,2-cyclic phosphodiesterase
MRLVFGLTVLGSGSSGNCSLVATDQCRILIDAGFSARQIARRLSSIGVAPEDLDGILLTHEHADHVAGLEIFARRFGVPIFCNPLTAETLRHGFLAEFNRWHLFQTGATFVIKDIEIQSFYVPHDAVDPAAFVLTSDPGSIGFLTDLGYAPKLAIDRLRAVHTLVIETNHDERMLQNDPKRPWSVKQRILSRHGHLSNKAAAELAANIAGDRLERLVLGHLSRDCNRQELALEAMHGAGLDILELVCAEQRNVSPHFEIKENPLVAREQVTPVYPHRDSHDDAQTMFDLGWQAG